MFTFGWFSSGLDQAAIDLFTFVLDHMKSGFMKGRLAFVFCDQAPGEAPVSDRFHAAIRERGVPLVTHSSATLRRLIREVEPGVESAREAFDTHVMELLKKYAAELVVLVDYGLIVSPRLCRAFLFLNLHPAVPDGPTGTWQEVIWQLMAEGAREAGAMMHLATPELDAGLPVTYFRFSLTGPGFVPLWEQFIQKKRAQSLSEIKAREGESEFLFVKIREEELKREFPLILLTLKAIAEGSLRLTRTGAKVQGCFFPKGLDLTSQVNDFLKG